MLSDRGTLATSLRNADSPSSTTTGSLITLHYSFRRDVRPSPAPSTRVGGPPRSLFYGELIISAAAPPPPLPLQAKPRRSHVSRPRGPTTSPSTMELRCPYDPLAPIHNFSTLFSLASRCLCLEIPVPTLSRDNQSYPLPPPPLFWISAGSMLAFIQARTSIQRQM